MGFMLSPGAGVRLDLVMGMPHALDNGCYSQGERFNLDAFYGWLGEMEPARDTCLFAVAPDVIGDAAATCARSLPTLAELRRRGWRAAYVAQDGETVTSAPWGTFDALFVGGVNCPACVLRMSLRGMPAVTGCRCFKWHGVRPLVTEAKRRGLWVHVGRVNSGKNVIRAARMGADSTDGTYMRFNPTEAIERMGRWVRMVNAPQLPLWEVP